MNPQDIQGCTRNLGKPQLWDRDCAALPVRDCEMSGLPFMVSEWKPTPEELRALVAGGSIFLGIHGHTHPVVKLWAEP